MAGESNSENLGLEDTLALRPKTPADASPEREATRRIGAYRLLQVIGEGGMGEVWLAEQDEPQVVARFESERQALALMDHPAIAKVFDAGSTPALETQRRVLGPEHPDALGTMANLALVEMEAGRFGDAAKLLQQTLEIDRRVLGPENPQTLQSVSWLATAYNGQGRYDEPQKLAQEGVAAYRRQKLQDSEDMGGARMALGWALMGQSHFPLAEQELIEAERLLSKAKGVAHKKSLTLLVATYEGWEKSEPRKGHGSQALQWKAKLDEATGG